MSPVLRRVAVVGGGPGGLFVAALVARAVPDVDVVVFERNRREDVFGFGVVFSDATLRKIDACDSTLREALAEAGTHWDRIEVWSRGERHGFAGNGMSAVHRKELLRRLRTSAEGSGVDVRFATLAPALDELREDFDLVVGADGSGSTVREQLEANGPLGHTVETAAAKFIWFATTHRYDGLTFVHRVSEHGNFAAHAYPISADLSTFIVETDADTWLRAGLDAFDVTQPPGASDDITQAYLQRLFGDDMDGGHLVGNNSRWASFRTRRTRRWGRGNVVLLGDAAHTAHFSVGSGTKMAMEDAIELAAQLTSVSKGEKDLATALDDYVSHASVPVAKVQTAAIPSLSWWEHFGTYQQALDPTTFAFHFFSRSIGIDKVGQRDPDLAARTREHWRQRYDADALHTPVELVGVNLSGRLLEMTLTAGVAALHDREGRTASVPRVEVPATATAADVGARASGLPDDGAVVVDGPPNLARRLLAERARFGHGLTVVVAGDDVVDPVVAETMILSGRTDAVAADAGAAS